MDYFKNRDTFLNSEREMLENSGDYEKKQEDRLSAVSRQADSMMARQNERTNRVLLRLGLRGEDQPPQVSVESIWDCRSSLSESFRPDRKTSEELPKVPQCTPGRAVRPVIPAPHPPQNHITPLVKSSKSSRIPRMKVRGGQLKELAGCRLLTTKKQVDAVKESAQRLHTPQCVLPEEPEQKGLERSEYGDQESKHCEDEGSAQSTAPVDTPVYVPTPPEGPPPRKPKSEPDDSTKRQHAIRALMEVKAYAQGYEDPIKELEEFFALMPMEDWEKKMSALDIIRTLIVRQPWLVKRDLHKICITLTQEISHPHTSVSSGIVDSLAMLLLHYEDLMDPEVETITLALMQQLGITEEKLIKEKINLALDLLVQNCNFGPVITALLNCGYGHQSESVRSSTVAHLGQVIDMIGVGNLFPNNKHLDERVIAAVSKMALDAVPEVRHEGERLLKLLADYWDFARIFESNLPLKDKAALREVIQDVYNPVHVPTPPKEPPPKDRYIRPAMRMQVQCPNCETWATVPHEVPFYMPSPPEGPRPKNRKPRAGRKLKPLIQAPESETCAPVPEEVPVYVPTPPKEPPPKVAAPKVPAPKGPAPKEPAPKNLKAGLKQKTVCGQDNSKKREKAIQALMDVKAKASRLEEPTKKLEEFFVMMKMEDWEKKMAALDIIQTLIVKHPKTVKKDLHKICVTLTDEILHLRSTLSSGVVDCLSMLFLHYKDIMDPEAEVITLGLMQRLGLGKEKFIKEKTNLALDLVVQYCDYGRVVTALLNCGHGQRSVSVRASTAVHLGQVIDTVGVDSLFASSKYLDERVIVALSQMSLDAVPEVRQEGRRLLKLVSDYWDFPRIFENLPIKDKLPLRKILKTPKDC